MTVVNAELKTDSQITFTPDGKTALSSVLDCDTVRVYTTSGEIIDASSDEVTFLRNGKVEVSGERYDGLYGVVANPPDAAVMDAYYLASEYIDAGESVLFVFLDGFGYKSYETALEMGCIPVLSELNACMATAAFPTITPVNYAAMATGQAPATNGVTERGVHELSCESIFDLVLESGKTAFIAEGNAQIIGFSVRQSLNVDLDGDGLTDGEVFDCAMTAIETGEYDLVFAHFHGIDDVSHETGPDSAETYDIIRRIDEYVGALMDAWGGRVIVVADHGQHLSDGTGDPYYEGKTGEHGAFASSDLFVPLLTN